MTFEDTQPAPLDSMGSDEFRVDDAGRAAQKIQKCRGIDDRRSGEQKYLIQRAVDGGYDSAILQ